MINNAIYILLVLLAFGEIGLIVCFINLMGKVRDAASANQYFSAIAKLLEAHREQNEDLMKRYDGLRKASECANEQYKLINDSYEIMIHQLKIISEQHQKILECWQSVEERYSDYFEQYKHTHECLKKCMDLMTPIATEIPESIEELGMKLNDVQEIVSRIDENTKPVNIAISWSKPEYENHVVWDTGGIALTTAEGD